MPHQSEEFVTDLVEALLARAGRCRLRVGGTSMLPAIQPGDTLCVQRVAPSAIALGDVILFSRAGRLFAHRVVDVGEARPASEWRCTTRGDAVEDCDPPVAAAEILGRVEAVTRDAARRDAGRLACAATRIGALRAVVAGRLRALASTARSRRV